MMSQKVEFSLTNQDGETISSSDLAGKKYVMC
jgi:peroxiredoxin